MTPEEGQAGDKIAGFGAIAPIMVQGRSPVRLHHADRNERYRQI